MAGATLRAAATLGPNSETVSGVFSAWGPVEGFCFEGSNCMWKVPGGGSVLAILTPGRVERLMTSAPNWRTARGIGPGASMRSVRRLYGRRVQPLTTCGLNGFGGDNRGLVLRSRANGERRYTFFEGALNGKLRTVWLGRGRLRAFSGC